MPPRLLHDRYPPSATIRTPRWPWVVLGLGLFWTVLLRVPLIVNAEDHLDSDLAVDGSTLIDAVHGQWRWHYPGTPHMGIVPIFLCWVQALDLGRGTNDARERRDGLPTPGPDGTLRAGVAGCGRSIAIQPAPTFSSTGTIWLSGRITGGHLLIVAWSACAWLLLHETFIRRASSSHLAGPLERTGGSSRFDVPHHTGRARLCSTDGSAVGPAYA